MLEVAGLHVSYGKHRALEGAGLVVAKGEIVVILGANGAGKSTLLKAICGVCEGSVAGSVRVEGRDILGRPPHEIVDEGLALVPEGRGIFPDMTVAENLTLGAYSDRARDEAQASLERVFKLFPKLRERRRQVARTMSGGEQQMVAIGRAMMSNPAILALDEPSLGLSPILCKELFQTLGTVRDAGLGLLLVEQNARQSLAIADRGYLLENGEIVREATGAELLKDPAVQEAYLGGAAAKGGAKPVPHAPDKRPAAAGPAPGARPASVAQMPDTRPAHVPTPRGTGPSPSEIAAHAVRSAQGRATPRSAQSAPPRPAVKPAPDPTPTPAQSRPIPTPTPRTPSTGRARDVLGGVEIGDLVANATSRADRRGGGGTRPGPGVPRSMPDAQGPPARSTTQTATSARLPDVPMPDLGSSADRLRRILDEIEGAAKQAESWRPQSSTNPRGR
ncbi:ABC transporter ATP-binding protein [Palleronia abyssalis]|mgnify:CR=1 FL=1|uniref:High-affinity branched-chain amino acid transport ATP-binding protein LivF n=1 Tax=Palleronia abyssalis TaxID=1501240 RepID=A0A2R8BVP8_9RHOB|nr:ABC transporter ATP-binding protein [Palleronia abyssalis]SPJ24200.1 High-affinity branched-chain amino acid transport ATP-binding protein LivF [Palleronia abyssalis]